MPTNYQRGRAFEYRTRNKLLKDGAVYVMRAAQSKGKIDLLVLWPHSDPQGYPNVWAIQCKRDGRLPKAEREALLQISEEAGCPAYLAKAGPKGRGIIFERLCREH
jgi:hypothetical protein